MTYYTMVLVHQDSALNKLILQDKFNHFNLTYIANSKICRDNLIFLKLETNQQV